MTLPSLTAALALLCALGGCATRSQPFQEVRDFAAESTKLDDFPILTTYYRDTYQREKPYLSASADATERALDQRRRAEVDDFLAIQRSLTLYLHTLGQLAGPKQSDFSPQVTALVSGIKAWPDSGIDLNHASAYTKLATLIVQSASLPAQEAAVQTMLRDGDAAWHSLIDAMGALLQAYDRTHHNEKRIVLGLFDVELALIDAPNQRLLSALAQAQYQSKSADYALIERRFKLAERNLAALALAHDTLLEHMTQQAPSTLPNAN